MPSSIFFKDKRKGGSSYYLDIGNIHYIHTPKGTWGRSKHIGMHSRETTMKLGAFYWVHSFKSQDPLATQVSYRPYSIFGHQ